MKALDRIDLIEKIEESLLTRMVYENIVPYFRAMGINTNKTILSDNRHWLNTQDLLDGEPDAVVLKIADELGIAHTYTIVADKNTAEATFWEAGHFRLFLSHLSTFKDTTAHLQTALKRFGISAFVAHMDIEPTKEWQDEIEAGLFSMDALAAILMPGFKESNWTDQEVGIAIGRGVLVIPIVKGVTPYGFIEKYQGLNVGNGNKTTLQVAKEIFGILVSSPKSRTKMLTCFVDNILQANEEKDVVAKLKHLNEIRDLPMAYLEKLREGAASATVFAKGESLEKLNQLLVKNGLQKVVHKDQDAFDFEDDIPF
ncbi:MAG: toll/interleukin-1 receptor domain-containing protein [Thiothrix litoralis]